MNEGLVVVVRSIIAFFTLLIFIRILGKQQISQLTFFDYVVGITIGAITGILTTDFSNRAWPHWVALASWILLGYLSQYISMKWRYAAKYLEGEPTIIIMNGMIMESALRKMNYRTTDIMAQLRDKDVFDLAQVDFAIIETNGKLSVLKKPEFEPLTAKDMNLAKPPSGISTELIYDGMLIVQNLRQLDKDKKWLMEQIKQQGINDISEVFLATLNPAGSLYIDKYKDHIEKFTDIGDYEGPY